MITIDPLGALLIYNYLFSTHHLNEIILLSMYSNHEKVQQEKLDYEQPKGNWLSNFA